MEGKREISVQKWVIRKQGGQYEGKLEDYYLPQGGFFAPQFSIQIDNE
jgi:hypothetical protein